jgi:hypothetical protein
MDPSLLIPSPETIFPRFSTRKIPIQLGRTKTAKYVIPSIWKKKFIILTRLLCLGTQGDVIPEVRLKSICFEGLNC